MQLCATYKDINYYKFISYRPKENIIQIRLSDFKYHVFVFIAHMHIIDAHVENQMFKKIKLEWGQGISVNTDVRNLKLDFENNILQGNL